MLRYAETHASRMLRLTWSLTRVAPLALALLLGIAVCQANAATVTDNFDLAHNYLADGVSGTVWDGLFTGQASVSVANANITNGGRLTLESAAGAWERNGTGLLLYIDVPGDFIATVYVAGADTVAYNDMGLMARVSSPVSGEDYVAARYFAAATWTFNAWRSTDDGVTTNSNASGLWPWLQLERSGDTFYFRRSNDGIAFSPIGTGSVDRPDLTGLALQVGIWQATFTGSSGAGQFDSFSLEMSGDGTGIPEPATLCLVGLGGAVLAFLRRRRAA